MFGPDVINKIPKLGKLTTYSLLLAALLGCGGAGANNPEFQCNPNPGTVLATYGNVVFGVDRLGYVTTTPANSDVPDVLVTDEEKAKVEELQGFEQDMQRITRTTRGSAPWLRSEWQTNDGTQKLEIDPKSGTCTVTKLK